MKMNSIHNYIKIKKIIAFFFITSLSLLSLKAQITTPLSEENQLERTTLIPASDSLRVEVLPCAVGSNIYRINLVGTDGTTKVSNQSIVKFNKAYDFRIFPNPASDYIDVDLKQYEGKTVTLQVYNSFGKVIATQQVERASSLPVHLDLNPIAAGQYLIRVTSEGRKAAVEKFVIQN